MANELEEGIHILSRMYISMHGVSKQEGTLIDVIKLFYLYQLATSVCIRSTFISCYYISFDIKLSQL